MRRLFILPALIILSSCGNQNKLKMSEHKPEQTEKEATALYPRASDFVASPLRNSITLELNASVNEVWALIGKLERMPEYSSGLKRLDANYNPEKECTDYTCYFHPMEEGGEVTNHSETILWYEANKGYASLADEPNLFGLQQSLGIITLKKKGGKTVLQWDTHFTGESEEVIKMNIAGFEQALNVDIAQNLINRFGGKLLENYIQKL